MATKTATQVVRARWLLPIAAEPIENGFVSIRNGRIVEIGSVNQVSLNAPDVLDLGDVAILPGMVNAHTHLEFSDQAKPIGTPGIELADWIAEVIAARQNGTPQDASQSETSSRERLESQPATPEQVIQQGLDECTRTGTVLVGEIATTPWARSSSATKLSSTSSAEVIAFAETLGLTPERSSHKLELAQAHLQQHGRYGAVSPHAPYSTPPALIQQCVQLAKQHVCGIAMHVAESPAERELLDHGSGPFANRLRSFGLKPEEFFPWKTQTGLSNLSPLSGAEPILSLIRLLATAPAAMLVHGNDLQEDEIAEVQKYPQLSVVYCPRTHHFFRHQPHPVDRLLAAGINVGLGTDSRASNPDLSLWREAQFLLNHRQDLTPHQVLTMATLGGANALQRNRDFGSLEAGKLAKLVSVSTAAANLNALHRDLAQSDAVPVALASDAADHN